MHPLESSKEKVKKFRMEIVPIKFEQTVYDILIEKNCPELLAVRNYHDFPYIFMWHYCEVLCLNFGFHSLDKDMYYPL